MLRDKRRCNFEAKWFKEEGFSETVEEKWQESEHNGAISVLERLKAMHDGQHDWDCTILKVPKKSPRKAHWELEVAMRGPLTPENNHRKFELRWLTENLLEQKEINALNAPAQTGFKMGMNYELLSYLHICEEEEEFH
jgi:hypothetical protein